MVTIVKVWRGGDHDDGSLRSKHSSRLQSWCVGDVCPDALIMEHLRSEGKKLNPILFSLRIETQRRSCDTPHRACACTCLFHWRVGMYVCMYVCMHVCMYVCMHACMYVRMYVCLHLSMNLCVRVCVL